MTESAITVRVATESDLGFVSQDDYLPESAVKRKVRDGNVFVALRNGEPVGYLRLESAPASRSGLRSASCWAPHALASADNPASSPDDRLQSTLSGGILASPAQAPARARLPSTLA